MAEMEDKFQEILGNEAAMSQIMSIAQSLSSGEKENTTTEWAPASDTGTVEELMGGLDPAMMALGMKLVSAYQRNHRALGLMGALRPFLKEERHDMLDKMSQATKIAQVICSLYETWKEDRGDTIV